VTDETIVYQRIGEFAVSFQWLENKLREIGWFIMDPERKDWPPKGLRALTNEKLIDKVHELFLQALPQCKLEQELEEDFKTFFAACAEALHQLRRDRNRILHSAFIELKACGEVVGLMRSNPRVTIDEESGSILYDQEMLKPGSFDNEMRRMGDAAMFLGRAYMQLIHRFPRGDTQPFVLGDLSRQAAPGSRTSTLGPMNTPPLFSILDSDELNALVRALLQAKFRPAVPDTDLPASRFVVAMIERALEAQKNFALASGNTTMVANFETWQRAEENPLYVSAARERLKECPADVWLRWSNEERLHYVQQVLSPLRAEQLLLEELLNSMPVAQLINPPDAAR